VCVCAGVYIANKSTTSSKDPPAYDHIRPAEEQQYEEMKMSRR